MAKRNSLTWHPPRAARAATFLCFGIAVLLLLYAPGCAREAAFSLDAYHASDSVFRVLEIDMGEQAWGQNLLQVRVKNVTDQEHPFWLHIGGRYRYSGHSGNFGMGMQEPILVAPHEEHVTEHPYWIPPRLGELSCTVKCVVPAGTAPVWQQRPFFVRDYFVTYETPNSRCNELTPLAAFLKYDWAEKYRDGTKIRPFEVVATEHFVFYVLPDSPGLEEIDTIKSRRGQTLKEICDFLGVSFTGRINFFLFPDAPSKRWCMSHQGDGLAFDTTIAEIYNEDTRVDPAHEITHIVASQIGNPPALLNEGLAVYMQSDHKWNDEDVDVTASRLLREAKLVPLNELIKRNEIGSQSDDGEVAYPQSASFVKFIIDRYGKEQFLKLYGKLKIGAQDNIARFKEAIGVNLETAEQEWRKAISRIRD